MNAPFLGFQVPILGLPFIPTIWGCSRPTRTAGGRFLKESIQCLNWCLAPEPPKKCGFCQTRQSKRSGGSKHGGSQSSAGRELRMLRSSFGGVVEQNSVYLCVYLSLYIYIQTYSCVVYIYIPRYGLYMYVYRDTLSYSLRVMFV